MNYATSDFPKICTLCLLGHEVIAIDKSQKRVVFSFSKTKKLEKHLLDLEMGKIRVNPFDFWLTERRCKQMLYSEGIWK